jgi:hypothetical protein
VVFASSGWKDEIAVTPEKAGLGIIGTVLAFMLGRANLGGHAADVNQRLGIIGAPSALQSNPTQQDANFERYLKQFDRKPISSMPTLESMVPTFDTKRGSSSKTPNVKRQRGPTSEAKLGETSDEERAKSFLRNAEFYADALLERVTAGWRTFFLPNGAITTMRDGPYKHSPVWIENIDRSEYHTVTATDYRRVIFPDVRVIQHRSNSAFNLNGQFAFLVWSSNNTIFSIREPSENARVRVFPEEIAELAMVFGRGEPMYLRVEESNLVHIDDEEYDLDDIRTTYGWPKYNNDDPEEDIVSLMKRDDLDADFTRDKVTKSSHARVLAMQLDQHVFATAETLLQRSESE